MTVDTALVDAVRAEIEDLHVFFVEWFTGRSDPTALGTVFAPRMLPETLFVSPDGNRLSGPELVRMFDGAHGANPGFAIKIRDVRVLKDFGDHLLADYTEWQRGAKASTPPDNGRVTTVILRKGAPFGWLHIHETWLPPRDYPADAFAF